MRDEGGGGKIKCEGASGIELGSDLDLVLDPDPDP